MLVTQYIPFWPLIPLCVLLHHFSYAYSIKKKKTYFNHFINVVFLVTYPIPFLQLITLQILLHKFERHLIGKMSGPLRNIGILASIWFFSNFLFTVWIQISWTLIFNIYMRGMHILDVKISSMYNQACGTNTTPSNTIFFNNRWSLLQNEM